MYKAKLIDDLFIDRFIELDVNHGLIDIIRSGSELKEGKGSEDNFTYRSYCYSHSEGDIKVYKVSHTIIGGLTIGF